LGAAHPEDHGGSEPRGTRAEIVLPSLDTSSYSILVVDADPSLRRALAQELRREGFEVLTAASLRAARELAATRRPNVLVTDIVRRHSDDACDLEAFRTETGARHLVVTADATSEAISGDDELEKPWDRARLIHAVRQLCVSRR
jgi:DNA-binding NtrC family response regulator